MATFDIVASLASAFRDAPRQMLQIPLVFTGFLIGAVLFYLLSKTGGQGTKRDCRSAIAFILKRNLYSNPTTRVDVWNYVLAQVLWFPLMRVVLTIIAPVLSVKVIYGALVARFSPGTVLSPDTGRELIAFQVFVLFICSEFGAYAAHWSLHKIPLLWSFHRVHHSAEALTPFTRLRDHPLDVIWSALGRFTLAGIMASVIFFIVRTPPSGAAFKLFLATGLVSTYGFDLWRHCHIPISLGRLNYCFNSPVMHQVHHSAEPRHRDKNLGAELMIFDWLFGSLYVPEGDESYRWGLNEDELGAKNPHLKLRDFYLEPFRYAVYHLPGRKSLVRTSLPGVSGGTQ